MINLRTFKITFCLCMLTTVIGGIGNSAIGQDSVPQLTKLAQWDDPYLPTLDDGQKYNDIWGWIGPDGREYVIMGSNDSTYFFDITRPDNPVIVDVKAGLSGEVIHRDYATHEHYCYAVNDDRFGSIQVFDLQYLPDSVEKVYDTFEHGMMIHNVFSDNGRLYLASNKKLDSTGFKWHPMTVLSLADPENPTLLSQLTASKIGLEDSLNPVHDVHVHNDTAYCSIGDQGLLILDYQNPDSPKIISHIENYPRKGYNHSSWTTSDRETLVFADETHGSPLKAYDISDLENPEFKALFGSNADQGSVPHNPFIKGDLVYTSYYHDGVQVFDISDPENPEHVAGYDTYPENEAGNYDGYKGCWGIYPFFPSGTIAASDMHNGLFLFRLDTVANNGNNIPENTPIEAKIWPNPFESELNITFEAVKDQVVHYTLFGSNGRRIAKGREKTLTEGKSMKIEGLDSKPPGLYWLKLETGNTVRHYKVLKVQ